ncbi:MAG TPA: hypothetical protein VGL19_24410, partial [Polyangiaceae bacterium]
MRLVVGLGIGMAAVAAACSAPVGDGRTESVGQVSEAVSYDFTMVKPVPQSFLTKKMDNNICCSGLNQTVACGSACATTQGLITSAGYDKAFDYYRATGQDQLDTLDKWKSYFNFLKQLPGETVDAFRARTNTVIYYNRTELALGRELACAQNGTASIACYVTNYGDSFGSVHDLTQPDADAHSGLTYARQGSAQPKNTVVISYDTRRESVLGDGTAVQFAAFGPDGKRLQKAQLDNMGARPIPQICMTCHGGVWDPDARTAVGVSTPVGNYYGISRFARFLPLITSTVTFSGISPYTQAEQENAIRVVNQAAWRARGTGLTQRQRALMGWLYSATQNGDASADLPSRRSNMMFDTLSFAGSTPTRQFAENAWPTGWVSKQALYNGTILPFCDTCHLAMDPDTGWTDLAAHAIAANADRMRQGGGTYNSLTSLANATAPATKTILAGYMGTSPVAAGTPGVFGLRSTLQMPHSEQTFERFWSDTSGVGGYNCVLGGQTRPMGECMMFELGIWPSGRSSSINWTALAPTADAECGQSVSGTGNTFGVDAGRRLSGVAAPDGTLINQCGDGCRASALCPGAESASSNPPFPGARQECVPSSQGSTFGSCKSCGRIGEAPCTQIGTSCNTSLNPNCRNLPACHEGVAQFGTCGTADLSHNGLAIASQSSTSPVYGGAAIRAIDGNYSGNWNDGSVTHTDPNTDPAP